MFDKATLIRFVEAFVAFFVVAFAADPIFNGAGFGDNIGQTLAAAAAGAALIALRRVVATLP